MATVTAVTVAGERSVNAPVNANWQAATSYKAGQLVVSSGLLYKATIDHTSGGSFTTTNWTLVSAPASVAIDDTTVSTTSVYSSTKTESLYSKKANNLSDLTVPATARTNLGLAAAPVYLYEVSGAYPNRPATTGPVVWRGPDAPGSGGTTAGGTANAVSNLDEWHRTP